MPNVLPMIQKLEGQINLLKKENSKLSLRVRDLEKEVSVLKKAKSLDTAEVGAGVLHQISQALANASEG